jgi:hypothetical protein
MLKVKNTLKWKENYFVSLIITPPSNWWRRERDMYNKVQHSGFWRLLKRLTSVSFYSTH